MDGGKPVTYMDLFNETFMENVTLSLNGSMYTPPDDMRETSSGGNDTVPPYHHKWCIKNPEFVNFFPEIINPQPNNTNNTNFYENVQYGNGTENITYTNYTLEVNVVLSNLQK